jgi:hypothetical protein
MAKRLIIIGLILVVGVGFAFAGGQGESATKSIAVIMPGATHGFSVRASATPKTPPRRWARSAVTTISS